MWERTDGLNAVGLDLSFALDHFILAAAHARLGTCWVCNFEEARAMEILGVPALACVVAMAPAVEARQFRRKPLADMVRRERW